MLWRTEWLNELWTYNCPWKMSRPRYASLVARTCCAIERWPLPPSRSDGVCGVLAGRSVESKLSMGAHVFFSREERMKVAEIFVRETVMLPIGTASCLMWKAFRGSGNRAVISSRVVVDSSVISAWLLQRQPRRYHRYQTAAVVIELLRRQQYVVRWWLPLKFIFVDGPFFVLARESDNGSDVFSVKRWLDSR